MKKLSIFLVMIVFLASGCGVVSTQSIKDFNQNYAENMAAVKEFAEISARDWLFGSGALQAMLERHSEAEWVINELRNVDKWFFENGDIEAGVIISPELNDWQLGYILGKKVDLTGPAFRLFLQKFAPGIFQIAEAGAFLAFLGL